MENKGAQQQRQRAKEGQLFAQVDPGTKSRVYPAIDPPSTWDSFEAEARWCQFATVTEQLVTVTVRIRQSVSKEKPVGPGRPATGTCLHEGPVYRQS